ncbi:bifunctional 3-(3-hydroxy-phenyl)propionate/3-hydroxycinnamic acid hydroxylase [Ornithinimicrobium sp. F0845]|uniref:bifunctional 3-(3-hydroxy-phenyl)propionate/3-hydroxycinnamic acid hydroxylase MhpA n=1 Tax=Ornithinimicrobium sp. F0845 TaxID=2926412 RepID=UPI00248BA35B|nr:bifunctional 3-(3-hydroxy-phenyl)propionate/3-hydroxycinnamic acid hydroxylase [Ornithinimicrobium sp. F0845]
MLPDTSEWHGQDTDLVVVGMGPVGLLTTILAAQKGHRVVAIERWPTPYALPRAVTFDHEIARILNAVGIDAENDPTIDYYDKLYYLYNADMEPLNVIDWASKAPDGWRNRYWFDQPGLEKRLRVLASSLPNVTMLQGYEVTGLEQDEDSVTVRFQPTVLSGEGTRVEDDATTHSVQGRLLVGSDGANSFVRRSLGLTMTDLEFNYDWVVVDVIEHDQHEYDPPYYQVCKPERPFTVVPGGPGRRRWEFMVLPGETAADFEAPARIWELLEEFDVRPDNADLIRYKVWRFQARYLDEWRKGRVAIAGDAAHLMPPFAGEGMCAGLRDVMNLSWRLDLILQGVADVDLLDSYGAERGPHARWFIDFSVGLGQVICVSDPDEAAQRDTTLMAALAEQLKTGPVQPYDARLGPGAWDENSPGGGFPSWQGAVVHQGVVGRFDQVVTRGWGLLSTHDAGQPTPESRGLVERMGGVAVTVGPPGSGADVLDVDGVYESWFAELGAEHILTRPDFHTAGAARRGEDVDALVRAIADKVLSPGQLGASPAESIA